LISRCGRLGPAAVSNRKITNYDRIIAEKVIATENVIAEEDY
jgi:hypothetical protein